MLYEERVFALFHFLVCMIKGHKLEKYKYRYDKPGSTQPYKVSEEGVIIPVEPSFQFTQPDYWLLTISDLNGDVRHLHPCSRCGMLVVMEEGEKVTGIRPFKAMGGEEKK